MSLPGSEVEATLSSSGKAMNCIGRGAVSPAISTAMDISAFSDDQLLTLLKSQHQTGMDGKSREALEEAARDVALPLDLTIVRVDIKHALR